MTDYEELREKAMEDTKEKMKEKKTERDKLIVQVSNSINNLDKTSNTMLEQFKDIYSLYFPELERIIKDPDLYLEMAVEITERERFTAENLEEYTDERGTLKKIEKAASGSTGADLGEEDLGEVVKVGEVALDMRERRKELEEYLEELMGEVAPNLKAVLGAFVGAKLMAEAGSLEKLMKMPSSTIQVLGAEKALFAHLNKGVNPPKHGIIFQHPNIKGSPREKRGKIARKVASKASIASRIDYFNGEFRGDELNDELEEEVEEILSH